MYTSCMVNYFFGRVVGGWVYSENKAISAFNKVYLKLKLSLAIIYGGKLASIVHPNIGTVHSRNAFCFMGCPKKCKK